MTGTPRASVPSAMPRRVTASSTVPSGLLAGFNRYTSSLRSPRRSALIRATGNRLLLLCIMLLHKKGRRPQGFPPSTDKNAGHPWRVTGTFDASTLGGRLAFCEEEPGFQYGVRV